MKQYIRSSNVIYEEISGTPLIFAIAKITSNYIVIDGYSNKSTIKGALRDLSKAVRKYNTDEADGILDMIKFNEIEQIPATLGGDYIIEWEPVSSAARHIDSDGIDVSLSNRDDTYENFDTEYADAKWYLMTRIVR